MRLSKLHGEYQGLFHVEHQVHEVILHDISEDHLEELPLELLIVEGDGTLQALPHNAVHKSIVQGGLAGATRPQHHEDLHKELNLHDISEDYLEELPLELLAIEGDKTL